MMAQAVILEGTWEEIKQHDAELSGRWLRVIVDADIAPHPKRYVPGEAREPGTSKPLRGMGQFKGKLGGAEALFKEKQKEKKREERRF